jgi:hypothetical protein
MLNKPISKSFSSYAACPDKGKKKSGCPLLVAGCFYPLPILPPRGQELLILSPLGEIRKGVVSSKIVIHFLM